MQTRRLAHYRPYPKQIEFHAAGAAHRERLFMAGNQLGKTLAGGAEAAFHATGFYPAWWKGRRFSRPTVGWAAGVSGENTRDNVQRMLLGRAGARGTGMIPAEMIAKTTPGKSPAELADTVTVHHVSGGVSRISFKSYEKGREKWQGETLDWVWFDEEPPPDVYTEGLTRTNATNGLAWMTFTPLKGMSEVVSRFLLQPHADRHVTQMTIDEALHFSSTQKDKIIASYPEHEVEARARGVPVMGSGRVFPVTEERIKEPAMEIADAWPRICGLDIGWDHPTAAVWLAWDRDADTVHVYLRNVASTTSNLRNQAFNTAANLGMQDANRNLAADTTNASNMLAAEQFNAGQKLAAQQFNNTMQNQREMFDVNAAYQGDQQRMQAIDAMQRNIGDQAPLVSQAAQLGVQGNELNRQAALDLFSAGTTQFQQPLEAYRASLLPYELGMGLAGSTTTQKTRGGGLLGEFGSFLSGLGAVGTGFGLGRK